MNNWTIVSSILWCRSTHFREAVPLQNFNAREFFRSLLCGQGGKNRTVAPVVANYNTILILLISTGLSF
jgi:hypothetical protein